MEIRFTIIKLLWHASYFLFLLWLFVLLSYFLPWNQFIHPFSLDDFVSSCFSFIQKIYICTIHTYAFGKRTRISRSLFCFASRSVTQTFASFFKLKYSLWYLLTHIEHDEKRERDNVAIRSNRRQDREHTFGVRSIKLFMFLAGCVRYIHTCVCVCHIRWVYRNVDFLSVIHFYSF